MQKKPTLAPRAPAVPRLDYEPRGPRRWKPGIGLVGCGSISRSHLQAYRAEGWRVVALCDPLIERARERQREFYPGAAVLDDAGALLRRDDVEVVDIATHPRERPPLIEAAILSGRHVLSQKPFVTDLDVGARLADLADRRGVRLAVNQNGRWAPYFSWMRAAVAKGLVGEPCAVHMACTWDHEPALLGTDFERIHHIILYDFAIHWFDALHCLMGGRKARSAHATVARAPHQRARPPLLAQATVAFDGGQASLSFDACAREESVETVRVTGTRGSLSSRGPVCGARAVEIARGARRATARLTGSWFPGGFAGTMGELLRAVEEKREPTNGARDNLESLALCFAAIASADTGRPQKVGAARRLPLARCTPTAR